MYELRTAGGYPIDEASSVLQKSIRRGKIKEATFWAVELNSKFPDYLFRRLCVIACEDIGPANPALVSTIFSMANVVWQLRKASKNKSYDLAILRYAILEMARSPKSRQADNLINEVLREMRMENQNGQQREVPDFALDVHTTRGKQMGRDIEHFWREGAKLENEIPPLTSAWGRGLLDGTQSSAMAIAMPAAKESTHGKALKKRKRPNQNFYERVGWRRRGNAGTDTPTHLIRCKKRSWLSRRNWGGTEPKECGFSTLTERPQNGP